jgi:hypothetical protein
MGWVLTCALRLRVTPIIGISTQPSKSRSVLASIPFCAQHEASNRTSPNRTSPTGTKPTPNWKLKGAFAPRYYGAGRCQGPP